MVKNVVLIMADSLQFNYLGCYGNTWIHTPNIDRLAREATLFENAYAEGLPTIPCRRAMLTGRYTLPSKGWGPLDPDDNTVADMLWGRGVHTALIYDTAPMHMPRYGYSRGFDQVIFRHGHELDHYFYSRDKLIHLDPNDFLEEHIIENERVREMDALMGAVKDELADLLKYRQYWKGEEDQQVAVLAKDAMKWLEAVDRTKPFLLWLDSFDPHEPWDPPSVWDANLKCPYDLDYAGKDMILPPLGVVEGVYTDEELHHIRMLYAEKITMVDKWVGKFLDKLRELGFWENTMIIFCADHGQPLGKGEHGHGIMRKCRPWPYEELAHIPFIVRVPGVGEGKRINSFIQSCDVAPTIVEYLDVRSRQVMHGQYPIPVPGLELMQGHSLLPLIRGDTQKVRDFAIAGYFDFSWSIIREDYSYIHWLQERGDSHIGTIIEEHSDVHTDQEASLEDAEDSEMWTCTPGAEGYMPEQDELYDRRTDPFQLNNIIHEHPEKAQELLRQLKEFMAELRCT